MLCPICNARLAPDAGKCHVCGTFLGGAYPRWDDPAQANRSAREPFWIWSTETCAAAARASEARHMVQLTVALDRTLGEQQRSQLASLCTETASIVDYVGNGENWRVLDNVIATWQRGAELAAALEPIASELRSSGPSAAASRVDDFRLAWRSLLSLLADETRACKARSDAAIRELRGMIPSAATTWQDSATRDFQRQLDILARWRSPG
jgi:hypothetical protein